MGKIPLTRNRPEMLAIRDRDREMAQRARESREREAREREAVLAERYRPTLTIAEVARRRGVADDVVARSIKRGVLAATCMTPDDVAPQRRIYRISEAEYANYIERLANFRPHGAPKPVPGVVERRRADGWITLTAAAKVVGVSRQRIEFLVRTGKLTSEREGILFVRDTDAHALLDARASRQMPDDLDALSDW